jgi:dihydrofolate reductase
VSERRERRLVYSMGVSLDGFIAGPGGEIDWGAPDEELHRFHNEQTRQIGVHLLGRRLYETMVYWEGAGQAAAIGDPEREFAAIWQDLPKVVFSSKLEQVEGRTTLAEDDLEAEIAKLRLQPDGGDIAIGGAGLAARAVELDLVDEYRPFVSPVVLGAGTPFLPRGARLQLELLETRRFGGVVYLRYRRV